MSDHAKITRSAPKNRFYQSTDPNDPVLWSYRSQLLDIIASKHPHFRQTLLEQVFPYFLQSHDQLPRWEAGRAHWSDLSPSDAQPSTLRQAMIEWSKKYWIWAEWLYDVALDTMIVWRNIPSYQNTAFFFRPVLVRILDRRLFKHTICEEFMPLSLNQQETETWDAFKKRLHDDLEESLNAWREGVLVNVVSGPYRYDQSRLEWLAAYLCDGLTAACLADTRNGRERTAIDRAIKRAIDVLGFTSRKPGRRPKIVHDRRA